MNRLKIETVVANQSGTMEADTISKNGRSLKSQMSKRNFFKVAACLCFFFFVTPLVVEGQENDVVFRFEKKNTAEAYGKNVREKLGILNAVNHIEKQIYRIKNNK